MFKVPSGDTAGTKTRDWHDIATLDKSSFYYIAYYELRLFPHIGKVPDLERVRVPSRKVMSRGGWFHRPITFVSQP
jgi:hypothetical protein